MDSRTRVTTFGFLLIATLAGGCGEAETVSAPAKRPRAAVLIETRPATVEEFGQTVERTGTLRARREIQIVAQEEGRLEALPFFEGDKVRKGAELFRLEDTLLRAQLRKAVATRRQAEADLARLERLKADRLVAEEELARSRTALEVARAEEELLQIRVGYARAQAPYDAIVKQRLAEPGDVISRFSAVLSLFDPHSLVTEVPISELLLPSLAVGDQVLVRIDALGPKRHFGRISRIYPAVDPATRQGLVEVTLEPAPEGALPGQLCRVTLQGRPQPRITVPFASLRRDTQGEHVYRVVEGTARRTAVITGSHFGERVEILEGVDSGIPVVVKGFLELNDGDPVRTAERAGERPVSAP